MNTYIMIIHSLHAMAISSNFGSTGDDKHIYDVEFSCSHITYLHMNKMNHCGRFLCFFTT